MFGQYLIDKKKISEKDLIEILKVHQVYKNKIGRLCVELGYIRQNELNTYLEEYLQLETINSISSAIQFAKNIEYNEETKKIALKYNSIVLKSNDEQAFILMSAFDDSIVMALEKKLKKRISILIGEVELIDYLKKCMGVNVVNYNINNNKNKITITNKEGDDDKLNSDDPYVKIIKSALISAKMMNASDIHFEPHEEQIIIRMRTHGVLVDWKAFSFNHAKQLIAKAKFVFNMDMAIVGRPQDTRASFQSFGLDIRVNSMPVTSGVDKIVLRLQYKDQIINIRNLGISEVKLNVLLNGIRKKDGLILISGPTGSGKTTTLYSLLEEMDRLGKNISTIENPVEKKLPRINQANICDDQDFAHFQRALMRQDPDVILLGEIRDPQTADLALKLSSTGHLVLSTVHANGAAEVVDRMKNLGIDDFTLKTNLRLSIAQRLVRELCPDCSIIKEDNYRFLNKNGCNKCYGGVIGRIAIMEYLDGQDLKNLGSTFQVDLKVRDSLYDESLRLVQAGRIDPEYLEGWL